ncbi:hypothetical protein SAMN06298216_4153 [Spirosomataceae bacterium TFI 002]|nr:hypothetical protein SAMN06298216_4153 [Spirosomataceae bacterium TFI 002]
MKKIVMLLGLVFAMVACNTESEETHSHEEIVAQTEFVCPMECEGDKTYDKPGECPVCKMELQEVAQVIEE